MFHYTKGWKSVNVVHAHLLHIFCTWYRTVWRSRYVRPHWNNLVFICLASYFSHSNQTNNKTSFNETLIVIPSYNSQSCFLWKHVHFVFKCERVILNKVLLIDDILFIFYFCFFFSIITQGLTFQFQDYVILFWLRNKFRKWYIRNIID